MIVNNRKGLKVFNQFLNGRLLGGEMAYLGNGGIQITGSLKLSSDDHECHLSTFQIDT